MDLELDEKFRDQYVEVVDGRDLIRYEGLRRLAHDRIRRIETKLLLAPALENGFTAIVQAVVEDTDGRIWSGIGDASPLNCDPELAPHKIRVAETRSKARALRDLLDLDMLAVEEVYPHPAQAAAQSAPISLDQGKRIKQVMAERDIDNKVAIDLLRRTIGKDTLKDLTAQEADAFITILMAYENRRAG